MITMKSSSTSSSPHSIYVLLYHSSQQTIGGAVRIKQTGFLEIKQIGSFAAWMQQNDVPPLQIYK